MGMRSETSDPSASLHGQSCSSPGVKPRSRRRFPRLGQVCGFCRTARKRAGTSDHVYTLNHQPRSLSEEKEKCHSSEVIPFHTTREKNFITLNQTEPRCFGSNSSEKVWVIQHAERENESGDDENELDDLERLFMRKRSNSDVVMQAPMDSSKSPSTPVSFSKHLYCDPSHQRLFSATEEIWDVSGTNKSEPSRPKTVEVHGSVMRSDGIMQIPSNSNHEKQVQVRSNHSFSTKQPNNVSSDFCIELPNDRTGFSTSLESSTLPLMEALFKLQSSSVEHPGSPHATKTHRSQRFPLFSEFCGGRNLGETDRQVSCHCRESGATDFHNLPAAEGISDSPSNVGDLIVYNPYSKTTKHINGNHHQTNSSSLLTFPDKNAATPISCMSEAYEDLSSSIPPRFSNALIAAATPASNRRGLFGFLLHPQRAPRASPSPSSSTVSAKAPSNQRTFQLEQSGDDAASSTPAAGKSCSTPDRDKETINSRFFTPRKWKHNRKGETQLNGAAAGRDTSRTSNKSEDLPTMVSRKNLGESSNGTSAVSTSSPKKPTAAVSAAVQPSKATTKSLKREKQKATLPANQVHPDTKNVITQVQPPSTTKTTSISKFPSLLTNLMHQAVDKSKDHKSSTLVTASLGGSSPDNLGPFLSCQRKDHRGRHTLVLDLDETLVHSSFVEVPNYNFVIPVEIDGFTHLIYVAKRPGVDQFLKAVAKNYEVVIFTASLAKYADPLMDQLDPNQCCVARLFREKCVLWNGQYVKDMSRMGRDLRKIVILDNSPNSYAFQPENAIPIESWFDDPDDDELHQLIPILDALAKVDDIPAAIKNSL